MNKTITRRRFVGLSVATGATILAGGKILGSLSAPGTATNPVFQIGGDLEVNRLGFGAMRLTGEGHLGLATRPRKRGQGVEARGRARCEFDRYRRRLRTGNGRAAHRRSAPSLSEGACHRDERRQHPARTRSVGAERSPRLSQTSCRQEFEATSARTDRFVSVAPRRSKGADGRIARRAQGNAERGENPARWIIGSVDVGN